MKKLIQLLAACVIVFQFSIASAQTILTSTSDTTYNTQLNTAFANLDKSKVPFGILLDYGVEFTNLASFSWNPFLLFWFLHCLLIAR
jgi:hypothetical protein